MTFGAKGSPLQGIICFWPFSIASIPDGWALCDGTNGTPDMSNIMVIGASDLVPPGTTGGDWTHGHTANSDNAIAYLDAGTPLLDSSPSGAFATNTVPHSHPVNVGANYHIPKYHALCFIMKL